MTAALEIKDLKKQFGAQTVVDGLSVSLRKGEFFSLLGPSGCGKSTTLAMIAGFLDSDSGTISIDGKVVNHVPPQSRGVGLVFQNYAVFTSLTVSANLGFGLAVKGISRARRRAMIQDFAAKLDLLPILDRRGATLNMSEMQRVAMARVLITEPGLLLLDEPMSNLDAEIRANLRGELKQLQRAHNQTVFYVTHDQVEALSMSDRVAVMHDGKLLQVGTPEEIYRRPQSRFVAEFIGDLPINIIPCSVRQDGSSLGVSTAGHSLQMIDGGGLESGRHFLAIRPHDIRVTRVAKPGYAPVSVRFIENFGMEHVLYTGYGEELLRVVAPPGFASVDDVVHVAFDPLRIHLIDRISEKVIPANIIESVQ